MLMIPQNTINMPNSFLTCSIYEDRDFSVICDIYNKFTLIQRGQTKPIPIIAIKKDDKIQIVIPLGLPKRFIKPIVIWELIAIEHGYIHGGRTIDQYLDVDSTFSKLFRWHVNDLMDYIEYKLSSLVAGYSDVTDKYISIYKTRLEHFKTIHHW